jgi:hypothetical protein
MDKIFIISGCHSKGIGCFPFHYLLDDKGHVIRVEKGKDGKSLIIDLGEIGERKKTEPGEYYTFDGCIRHALTPEEYLEWIEKTPKWSTGYECPYTLRKGK